MRDENITLCCCSRGNDLYYKVPIYVLRQSRIFKKLNYYTFQCGHEPVIDQLLPEVAKIETDYIHYFDGDVGLDFSTTEKLVECDKDIIVSRVWHYIFGQDVHLNVHYTDKLERHHAPKAGGIEPIAASSFSSMMIKPKVLQAFIDAGESFQHWSPLLPEACKDKLHRDTVFFAKAHYLGFQPYVCWDVPVGSHHRMMLLETNALASFAHDWYAEGAGNNVKKT